jgi:hypothetical protein
MTLFACVHGRLGNCRSCDISEAQDRTTSAVESPTAIRDAEAAVQRRATQERRQADAGGAAHRWPERLATVALALAGYALWLDGWSALALAAAVAGSFVLTAVLWSGVASRRERSDRFDGAYPVLVLVFALTSAALLYLPPWIDASLWRFGVPAAVAAMAAIALVPLLRRFAHVPTVAR